MTLKILRSLTCFLFILSTAGLLRADRDTDRRNERIPVGHQMHPPQHKLIVPFSASGPTGYTPAQLRHAYGFDQLSTTGQGQTIAIVDAYGSPTIQADLNTFCTAFGIPSTTVQVYYPQGTPPANSGWATETSLDVEWTHAIAPGATIVLVASKSAATTDLLAAVDYAVSHGANEVSMSWGGPEFSTEATSDYHFNVPGVTFLASSGDSGAGAQSPACSPYVVGVGGTTLHLDSSNNISSETAWSGSGGGASAYQPAPSYQAGWWSGTTRGVPDVAYDADPSTGVPVYITGSGWGQWGGTSISAPQWAALFALANSLRAQPISTAPSVLYSLATANYSGNFHDITSGTNGNPAGPSYDLVTGLGTPLANQLVLALAGGFSSQVAAPVFFPPAGVYSSAQNVTILSATPGASIRYTLDGSTPSETNGTLYSGPVNISSAATLKAIAYEAGFTDSPVTSGSYTFMPQAATPVFSPPAGAYANAQTVTITSATSGVTIRYTTDDSLPTETNGTIYSGPVSISANATLKAIAYASGFLDSTVASGDYAIGPQQVAAPTFSPPPGIFITTHVIVTISTVTSGASIRYTLDGSTPTETSGTLYSGPVTINSTATLTAIAYASGFIDSPVTSGNYTIYPPTLPPVFSPPAGNYTSSQTVTITSATSGASIYYTTDGSTPGFNSGILYSGPVPINVTTTLKAVASIEYSSFIVFSPVTTGVYTITVPAAAPVFSPAAGTYATAQTVTIASSTSGASIRYTTDGSTPTETNGTLYSGPVSVGSTTMLKAIAYGSGFGDSQATSGLYIVSSSPAEVFNVVRDLMPSSNAGFSPMASLVLGSNGNFYGTTISGGSAGYGTVFEITPAGVLTALASFNLTNGDNPGTLVQGSDGNFYGTTASGGSASDGTAFKMTPAGVLTTLISFNSAIGTIPGALVQGSDGDFYGTTGSGASGNNGTVFKLTSAGVLTTLVSFNYTNGTNANALVQGSDGNFYGTTFGGGNSIEGTAFKMTPAGDLTPLVSFNSANGANPWAALVQGSDGNFYGTTYNGGSDNDGTVFKITSAGDLTPLVSFNSANGAHPRAALVQGNDGNFYGTTYSGGSANKGTVFKMTPAGDLTTLVSFSGANGAFPYASLVQGNDGNLYGTCIQGGTSNEGVIFQLILPQAAAPVFSPAAGTYTGTQNVTIASATPSALIRYTTDGSTPTETNGTLYAVPVTISATTTLQAIAYASGLTDSAVTSGTYTISHPVPGWALRDFNGDGQPDILWHNATTGDVAVWTLNGTAVTDATFIANIGSPWSIVAVGDFNQDNNADILWHNATTGEIGVTLMNRTTITSYVGLGILDSSWTVAGLGDFNGDGQTDILLQNTSTGEVGFWSLNGTTVTGFTPIGTIPSPWTIAGVGDFNGDGNADLLWYNSTTGDMIVSLMNGANATGYQAVGNLPLPWTVAGLADFNGDGSVDILLRNATTGDIGLFLMNGTTPTSFVLLGNVPAPWQPSD